MSELNEQQQPLQQLTPSNNSSTTNSISPTNSISLIKLDELSSFGATKQSRLPALIKMSQEQQMDSNKQPNSMPTTMSSSEQVEKNLSSGHQKEQVSLPAQLQHPSQGATGTGEEGKENEETAQTLDSGDSDFQMVDMSVPAEMMGPSLPQPQAQLVVESNGGITSRQSGDELMTQSTNNSTAQTVITTNQQQEQQQRAALASQVQYNQPPSSHLGDSLIDMVINLRNENQNLVRALETNNDYVKERINEFKRVNDEAKRREVQYAMEKAENEHQVRKLQRQNLVLSERLKSMESKLKDMKLEISDSLAAANSSKASSIRQDQTTELYPQLADQESFGNSALNPVAAAAAAEATTIQMDATSGELYHNDDHQSESESTDDSEDDSAEDESEDEGADSPSPTAPPMDTTDPVSAATAAKVSGMSKEELSKRFDSQKAEFYALEDPMKQCDKLEQQLNDIGKRDYEICLLQQQLNIYRQDYRLERMANLEAKIQIERLKNDIDRLCLDRLNERSGRLRVSGDDKHSKGHHHLHRHSRHRSSAGGRAVDAAGQAADAVMSKLTHQLSKRASRAAAKAAKYAAKQAHREEKAAARAAASVSASAGNYSQQQQQPEEFAQTMGTAGNSNNSHHHRSSHRRGHSHLRGLRAVKSEVVNDLMSTANKAMLTGYKMASTHVNLALDKLSQFEQAQASNLAQNRQQSEHNKPMGPPSVD